MGLKYSLPSGEVIEIDIDDCLQIDFTTIHGKHAMQTIIEHKDYIKNWKDFDAAENNDSLKYQDIPLEEFDEDIYKAILKDQID